jgi:RNA 2',3'-cyclic 3'-phosphodiesterase
MSRDTEPTIRSFVAIELPEDARVSCEAAIERARSNLGRDATAVRWVDPGAIHLTLQFLGAVPTPQVEPLTDALRRELAGQPPLSLAIGRLGLFPNQRAPRVIWLALLGDLSNLPSCQHRVEAATEPLGYPREKRPFQPHLTIGRVRDNVTPEQLSAIGRLPSRWPADISEAFSVTSVSLMQSHLGPGGAQYSRMAELSLQT